MAHVLATCSWGQIHRRSAFGRHRHMMRHKIWISVKESLEFSLHTCQWCSHVNDAVSCKDVPSGLEPVCCNYRTTIIWQDTHIQASFCKKILKSSQCNNKGHNLPKHRVSNGNSHSHGMCPALVWPWGQLLWTLSHTFTQTTI